MIILREKEDSDKVKKLLSIGGKEWKKGDKHRIYFDGESVEKLIGIETQRYKSGSIKSATFNGEEISNNKAHKMIMAASRAYYDVDEDKFYELGSSKVAIDF
jgi:hypothetical protein